MVTAESKTKIRNLIWLKFLGAEKRMYLGKKRICGHCIKWGKIGETIKKGWMHPASGIILS